MPSKARVRTQKQKSSSEAQISIVTSSLPDRSPEACQPLPDDLAMDRRGADVALLPLRGRAFGRGGAEAAARHPLGRAGRAVGRGDRQLGLHRVSAHGVLFRPAGTRVQAIT